MTPEEIALKYMSPRAMELELLDKYVRGTQYDGRPDWFDQKSEAPLIERKPCIIDPVAKTAIGSHVAFVLGEGRWPNMTSSTSEDDRAIDEDWGLDNDDSNVIDRFVNVVLVRYAGLKSVARAMLSESMAMRSVAVVASIVDGHLVNEPVRASGCVPTLNRRGECVKLEIRYPFIETYYDDRKAQYRRRCMLYRREIDATADTVWKPAEARADGREPTNWVMDQEQSTEHDLGFCPVLWYPFMKVLSASNQVDGIAIHEDQLDEIDCLNITLSQKQRAATMAGDPQIVETGVAEGENPAPEGRASRGLIETRAALGPDGQPMMGTNGRPMVTSGFVSRPTGGMDMARKKGAGVIWRYRNKDSRVAYLAIPADCLKVLGDHGRETRTLINEALAVVHLDPSQIRSHTELSSKSLETFFARQTGFDDQIREDFGEKGLLGLVSMNLRLIQAVVEKTGNPKSLHLPGLTKLQPILDRFVVDQRTGLKDATGEDTTQKVWMPPRMANIWGRYFDPNEADQLNLVKLVAEALTARVITREMAVQKLADTGVFNIENAEAVVKAIEEAIAGDEAELHALMDSMKAAGGSTPAKGSGGDDAIAPAKSKSGMSGYGMSAGDGSKKPRPRHYSKKWGR